VLLLVSLVALSTAQDCVLLIPPAPLSQVGLQTPYQQTVCDQANPMQASFVQGAILDTGTNIGNIVIYSPLVINMGTKAAAAPTVIAAGVFPTSATVALWFGTNGNSLTLTDGGNGGLAVCTNGVIDPNTGLISIFGQFAYCNTVVFFQQAFAYLKSGVIVPPPLGVAVDGLPCPTIRDFFVVDQDPSDNVVTAYIVTAAGLIAQNTSANIAKFNPQIYLLNGSDNRLLTAMDAAIGCTPYKAIDVADVGSRVAANPLNEMHAVAFQQAPISLIPNDDPMTKINNQPNLNKVNAYRQGCGQPAIVTLADADTGTFCFNLYITLPLRLLKLAGPLLNAPSPDINAADSLYTFLGQRFVATFGAVNLNCFDKLMIPATLPPITLTLNGAMTVGLVITPPNNGPNNPVLAATTGAAVAAKPATTGWSTTMIIAVAVGSGVGVLVIIGFIVAFRAHRVRNFCSGVRDGIATKMRD